MTRSGIELVCDWFDSLLGSSVGDSMTRSGIELVCDWFDSVFGSSEGVSIFFGVSDVDSFDDFCLGESLDNDSFFSSVDS